MGRRKKTNKRRVDSPPGQAEPRLEVSPRRALSDDDAALWERVTQSLTPFAGEKDRLHFGPLLDEKPLLPDRTPAVGRERPRQAAQRRELEDLRAAFVRGLSENEEVQGSRPSSAVASRQRAARKVDVPVSTDFSRHEMRQINSGRQPIEARLDLHGLYQEAAHMALRHFLRQCQDRDVRHVLVITGKGRTAAHSDLIYGEAEYGVLRRVVPLWLAEADLREIVSGFSQAPRRHGGAGALYVRLRRSRSM